ncbi:MAG TPA: alcohol dehydrogenase catalytic domain-containing protein [Longimicrobiales bacterium]|nr:alcohol dehydrogenase catalytic domain-containing protein [Longimicrobiales bacterium]
MNAITFADIETLHYGTVPDPILRDDADVIVRVEAAGICGSDLHPYLGRERGLDPGTVMGHEFTGHVVEIGSAVKRFGVGDRVVAPFTTSCGACWACAVGLTARCVRGQLFGWVQNGTGLHGAQAEFVRVPLADSTLVRVPHTLPDAGVALLAGDVLATAMFAAEMAQVGADDVVAIVGCGPVGVLAVRAAIARGARHVFALDAVTSRLQLAAAFGATPLSIREDDFVARVREVTDRPGADCAIEAVGSPEATRTAADMLRPGGRLAAVGVHTEPSLALSPGELYDRNLAYVAGRCPARRLLPDALVLAGREVDLLARLITHRLPLARGVDAYRALAAREEGWGKVVLEM